MVQSLLKAIDILRLIAGSENGMRLNEIAEAFDMKKTTVHNLIRTLRARGFLEKDSANRFIPGPAVQELASMRIRSRMLACAGAELRKLSRRFPEAVLTFSEITPSTVICRLRMSPDRGTPASDFASVYAVSFRHGALSSGKRTQRRRF